MNRHELIHLEEKPFSCKFCGQKFSDKGNMRKHERIHTGEKSFSCSYCSLKFKQEKNLFCHEQVHVSKGHEMITEKCSESELPHFCRVCKEVFIGIENLKNHETICKDINIFSLDENSKNSKVMDGKLLKNTENLELSKNECKNQPSDVFEILNIPNDVNNKEQEKM